MDYIISFIVLELIIFCIAIIFKKFVDLDNKYHLIDLDFYIHGVLIVAIEVFILGYNISSIFIQI